MFLPAPRAQTVASIDLAALDHNLRQVRQRIGPTCRILAVVKADGYGHGAIDISRALAQSGVDGLVVATVEEGIALRERGLRKPVLVIGGIFREQARAIVQHGLTPLIHDLSLAEPLAAACPPGREPLPVHLKIDTGMGRLGLAPEAVLPAMGSSLFKGHLRLEGLMTHLADADNEDSTYTNAQLRTLQNLLTGIRSAGLPMPQIHTAGSAGILCYPASHFDAVRPGIMLYGYHTCDHLTPRPDLKPVLSLTTRVLQVRAVAAGDSVSYNRSFVASRTSRIAVLPIGYADGYSRALSDRGQVLVRGRRAPIAGRICMDLMMIDVTEIPDVQEGDEAALIGSQGNERITADDLAAWQGTIAYEVLCAIGTRIPRIYHQPDAR